MTEAQAAIDTPDERALGARHSPLGLAFRRLLRKKIAVLALIFIAVFYFCGLFAPLVAPHSYTDQNLDSVFQGPSLAHPLGTDSLGRDVLSRVIWASRTTVIVTIATLVTGGLVLSVSLGLLAGYMGGKVDTVDHARGRRVLRPPRPAHAHPDQRQPSSRAWRIRRGSRTCRTGCGWTA